MQCPSFDVQRKDLLAGMIELLRPFLQITDLSNDILELTLRFIHETGRFD